MINKNQRISDFFLKHHYQRQSSIKPKPPKAAPVSVTTPPTQEEEPKLPEPNQDQFGPFSILKGRHLGNSAGDLHSIPLPASKTSPLKQKRKLEQVKLKPESRITIFHVETTSKKHFLEHPVNKVIKQTNHIINLIFKQQLASKGGDPTDSPKD